MKILSIALLSTLLLAACKDEGQHLGNSKRVYCG